MNIINQIIIWLTTIYLLLIPATKYREGVVGQPESFLPHQAKTQNDKTISSLLYRGLFKYDNYGNLVPDLAESWTIDSDGLVYTVTIKSNQYWSDGSKITSDDIIYTSFKTPDLQGVGTDRVDDKTVRFILPNEFSPFLSLLTAGIMKDQTEEEYDVLKPPSNGHFSVLNIQRSGPIIKEIVLLNEHEDEDIQRLIFRYYSNDDELVTAAKLGEIDGFLSSKNYELDEFSNNRFPLQGVYFGIYFNLDRETVQDVELRKKLEMVINKEQLIFNKGILVQGPISRSVFTNEDIAWNPYDKDLKEDLEVDLEMTVPDIESHIELSEVIRDIWKDRLDVNLKIKVVPAETFVEDVIITREYELLFFGQEISRDPGRYINWHSTQKQHPGLNLSMFEQVKSDQALERGRSELENDERVLHYNAFQEVFAEQVPAILMYHPYENFYVSEYIEGVGEKYTFTEADRFLDFNKWTRIHTN
jgi:peptide/nickel transport system substrate-binding protein